MLATADYFRLIVPHQTPAFDSSLPIFYRDRAREYLIVPAIYYQNGNYFTTTAPSYRYHPSYRMEYQFFTFYHPFVPLLVSQLNRGGVDALYHRELQLDPVRFAGTSAFDFGAYYQPTDLVLSPYPTEAIDFDPGASYALYNWELFYHAPFWSRTCSRRTGGSTLRATGTSTSSTLPDRRQICRARLETPQRYWITKPLFVGQGAGLL